jgi:hypothetical protein
VLVLVQLGVSDHEVENPVDGLERELVVTRRNAWDNATEECSRRVDRG